MLRMASTNYPSSNSYQKRQSWNQVLLLLISFCLVLTVLKVIFQEHIRISNMFVRSQRIQFNPFRIMLLQSDFISPLHSDESLSWVLNDNHNRNNYTVWSSDFHIGPIADLKDILTPLGITVIDKSLSAHCHLKNTCAKDLKVLNQQNGITLGDCPNRLREDFYNAYVNDSEMQKVDAFLCNHACGICELFMPFGKPLVVIASTRYEIGRHEPMRWLEWNENLRKIAASPRNIVAANNLYDAEYIKYFTGIQDVQVIPSYCGYVTDSYSPIRSEILVGPSRSIHEDLYMKLQAYGSAAGVVFSRIRDLYPHFTFSQLAQHPAIVLFPYQVSIMSIFEYYRLGLPIFVPSPRLLTKWHLEYRILRERTWDGVLYGRFSNVSRLPCHPSSAHRYPYDPNNELDESAIQFWMQFADFYVLPHIQTFESFEELMGDLRTANLTDISRAMQVENVRLKAAVKSQWLSVIDRLLNKPSVLDKVAPHYGSPTFKQAMLSLYGIKFPQHACLGYEEPGKVHPVNQNV